MTKTIQKRISNDKQKLIDQIKQLPIIQVACQKCGTGRATYYRWRKEDKEFCKLADQALYEGKLLINDLAESKLLSAIQDQNMTGIIFWLKHNHPQYTTRVEIATELKDRDLLTKEQEKIINQSLALAGLLPERINNEKQK